MSIIMFHVSGLFFDSFSYSPNNYIIQTDYIYIIFPNQAAGDIMYPVMFGGDKPGEKEFSKMAEVSISRTTWASNKQRYRLVGST